MNDNFDEKDKVNQTQAVEETTEQQAEETPPQSDGKPHREAAKYRQRLRETETERDLLSTQLAQAREVILEATLDPKFLAVLKLSGRDTTELFTEEGTLDDEVLNRIGAELDEAMPDVIQRQQGWQPAGTERPLQLRKAVHKGARAPFDPDEGKHPNTHGGASSWQEAFTPQP